MSILFLHSIDWQDCLLGTETLYVAIHSNFDCFNKTFFVQPRIWLGQEKIVVG